MTNKEQEELVREKIVRIARIENWRTCSLELRWENGYCKDKECSDCKADQILAIPELKILTPDQSIPKGLSVRLNKPELSQYIYGKEALDKDNWVKVVAPIS